MTAVYCSNHFDWSCLADVLQYVVYAHLKVSGCMPIFLRCTWKFRDIIGYILERTLPMLLVVYWSQNLHASYFSVIWCQICTWTLLILTILYWVLTALGHTITQEMPSLEAKITSLLSSRGVCHPEPKSASWTSGLHVLPGLPNSWTSWTSWLPGCILLPHVPFILYFTTITHPNISCIMKHGTSLQNHAELYHVQQETISRSSRGSRRKRLSD